MAAIRPLERGDLPAVASLYEHIARSGSRVPPTGLVEYFERTLLDHPWADPAIPSLVYLDDGGVVAGFIGSSVRRMLVNGRAIRMGVAGQLVAEPRVRSRAAGTFLMKEYLDGAQDLTITDTASETVRRIWERIGGETFQLGCIGWIRAFRPVRFAGAYAAHRGRSVVARAAGGLARLVDPLATRALRDTFAPQASSDRTERLSPSALVEHLPDLTRSLELRPDYDETFAEWVLREASAVTRHGVLVAHLVRDEGGEVIGWYVYYRRAGGIGNVLQVAAREEEAERVLGAMFQDAAANGSAGLQGRVEGILREPLARSGCLFHPSGYRALLHSRDPSLLHAHQAGRSLLTRLEGEWWMGHHLV